MNDRLITAGAACFLMRFFKIQWFNLGSELKVVQREHTDILKMLEIFPPNAFRLQNINTFYSGSQTMLQGTTSSGTNHPFPTQIGKYLAKKRKQKTKMQSVEASLWGCQPFSNVNAFVWPQMTDFIHFWLPLEICCTHSYAWCQEDKENWNFNGQINVTQLKAECTALFSLTNSRVH